MSSPEPPRPEYERRVAEWLRRFFLESNRHLDWTFGGRVRFEDVRLEGAGSEGSSVVITFRASGRPRCLFGRRVDAVGPPEPLENPGDAPEHWAQMVWILLEEDILTGTLPRRCDPEVVTWF